MSQLKQKILGWSVAVHQNLRRTARDEQGAQAVEWVLLALVIIGLMVGISKYFQTEGSTKGLAEALANKLESWVKGL
jgi:Flp pilus assembly pilin Flp